MTRNEILQRFPFSSAAFIKANLDDDTGLRSAQHRQSAASLASDSEGKTQGRGLLLVRFTVSRKRLLDVDAKYAAVKHLLDCVVAAGIVAGDKEGQITLEVVQQKIKKGESESTVVEVIEPK